MFRATNYFSLLLLLFTQITLGQDYSIKKIELQKNNQTSITERVIFLDSNGFLWYSGVNSVVVEMGSQHKVFNIDSDKGTDFQNLDKILETKDGKIWITSATGAVRIDPMTGEVFWMPDPKEKGEKHFTVHSIFEDSNENIWYTNFSFISCLTKKGAINYPHPTSEDKNHSLKILFQLGNGNLIVEKRKIITEGYKIVSYYELSIKDSKINLREVEIPSRFKKLNKAISFSENGEVFPKDSSGHYTYNSKKYPYKYMPLFNKQIYTFPHEIKSDLTTSLKNRFSIRKENKLLHLQMAVTKTGIKLQKVGEILFKKKITSTVISDNNYNYFTNSESLLLVKNYNNNFFRHLNLENKKPISTRNFVKNSKGDIYVLTHNKTPIFIKKSKNTSFIPLPIKERSTDNLLSYNRLHGLYKLNDSTLIGYGYDYYNRLIKIDLKRNEYSEITLKTGIGTDKSNSLYDIEKIDTNVFLVGSAQGLYEYHLYPQKYTKNKLNDSISLYKSHVQDVYLDRSKKNLWLATKKGLYRKNLETQEVIHFSTDSKEYPLVSNNVKVIIEDKENTIWAGTESGLLKILPESLKTKTLTKSNGLNNDNIVGIIEQDDFLWISTFNGLVRYHKILETIETFFKEDGVPNNEFNTKSFFKENETSFYFGGIDGLVNFNPYKIQPKLKSSRLFLTFVEKFDAAIKANRKYTLEEIKKNGLTIKYAQNYARLSFAINDIFNADKHTYQYRISNLREDWVNLGKFHEVQLQGIKAGSYLLEVRGFSDNGISTNIYKVPFKIEQVFYKSTAFILFLISIAFTLVFIWFYYRKKSLLKEHSIQTKFTQLENKALRAQMNPHFIFNTLNGIQSIMFLKGELEANRYLDVFSKLLRLTIDMSNSDFIYLQTEIEYLQYYLQLEKMRMDGELSVSFDIQKELNLDNMKIPTMLFQPLIENAILHGLKSKEGEKTIAIKFYSKEKYLIGEIVDNGIGRVAAEEIKRNLKIEHTSWATKIMNERMEISNSIFEKKMKLEIVDLIENDVAKGTKVMITIPIE